MLNDTLEAEAPAEPISIKGIFEEEFQSPRLSGSLALHVRNKRK